MSRALHWAALLMAAWCCLQCSDSTDSGARDGAPDCGSCKDADASSDAKSEAADDDDGAGGAGGAGGSEAGGAPTGKLTVSANGHFLEQSDGTPFFFLSDTEWLLNTHNDDQVIQILDDRKAKGFTVVQVFATRNWNQATTPESADANGNHPFVGDDVTQFNPAYWDRWRSIVDRATERGLHLLLIYGEPGRLEPPWMCQSAAECYQYGRLVGDRFKDKPNVIFCNGQDSDANDGIGADGWRAAAEGVADGVNGVDDFDGSADFGTNTISYHGYSIYETFQSDAWIDFYGQEVWHDNAKVFDTINTGYNSSNPTKPIALLEGSYESETAALTPHYVRVEAWHAFFAGAMGYAYGHVENWNQYQSVDYLDAPAANQMSVLASFMTSRSWWNLVPDQFALSSGASSGSSRKLGMRAGDGSECDVYYPVNESAEIDMACVVTANAVAASWLDPRNGDTVSSGTFQPTEVVSLQPPNGWEDAVLTLTAN
jgi:Protein of unknown function (DUF4038)/Putative collagen-binding domain of a collagenase